MDTLLKFTDRTFLSLKIRNYRLYFIGQAISLCGTWMQTVAQGWLVLQLTGSGAQLGIVVALQFVPMLVAGPWGGVIVDRLNKRRILFWTQSAFGLLALGISVFVFLGLIQLWMLYMFALCLGIIRVFDDSTRHIFIFELVGDAQLKNAISLNSTANNLARVIGPTIAGILIAGIGIPFCFLLNGLSYVAVLFMLSCMTAHDMHASRPNAKKPGQLLEGFRYVRQTPVIAQTLLMMAFLGMFAYEFQVTLPLLTQQTFHGTAANYAALLAAMGVGSMLGGLFSAGRRTVTIKHLVIFSSLFGVSILAAASMPTFTLAAVCMFFVGFFSINVTATGNTMIQLESAPQMRGRVMSLWNVAMIGTTPIGGPIVGLLGQYAGARWSLALGGIAALAAAGLGASLLKKVALEPISEEIELEREEVELADIRLR